MALSVDVLLATRWGERLSRTFGATVARRGGSGAGRAGRDIRAATSGFALRAVGDDHATMAGQDFVARRTDERDRIYFAREEAARTPQTLINVPLGDPAKNAQATALTMLLLLDAGVGLGGVVAEGAGNAPQLQIRCCRSTLGLAMTDRDGRFLAQHTRSCVTPGSKGGRARALSRRSGGQDDKAALVVSRCAAMQGPASSGDMAVRLRHSADRPGAER